MTNDGTSPIDINALGLRCPEPMMMLHAAMRKRLPGERVQLRATDPSTSRDVDNFCRFLGHTLHHQECVDGQWLFVIEKKQ